MGMGLRGRLSNPPRPLADLFQYLTSGVSHQVRHTQRVRQAPGEMRRLGDISRAIVNVLAEAGAEMRVRTIHAEVERVLGESVSFYSVADYVHRRSRGVRPLFERTRYGHYRLLSDADSS